MRIDRLALHHFRGLESREFTLSPQFNLLVGPEGSGKTSVLEALSVALGAWSLGLPGTSDLRPITPADLRQMPRSSRRLALPATRVEAAGRIGAEPVGWVRSRTSAQAPTDDSQTAAFVLRVRQQLARLGGPLPGTQDSSDPDAGAETPLLPLIAYYRCERDLPLGSGRRRNGSTGAAASREDQRTRRLSLRMRRALALADRPASSSSDLRHRLTTYADALDIRLGSADLEAWLLSLDKPVARVVLDALQSLLNLGSTPAPELHLDRKAGQLQLRLPDGLAVDIEQLGHGQRQLLTLVGDLASRAINLNPHLGADALARTSGVVLIDEIEAHLHPQVQGRLTETLRELFPALQFIAATNSPFLVRSLRSSRELLPMIGTAPADLAAESLDHIASTLMRSGRAGT
jgi:predicted ATP-binding protein involved in virulence